MHDYEDSPADANVIYPSTKFHTPGMRAARHSVPKHTAEQANKSEHGECDLRAIEGFRCRRIEEGYQ